MAEKYPARGNSPDGKPVPVSPCSSSGEPSLTGPSELQPYSRGRMPPPGNQSSVVVPVRLDVLLFLLNSAARGAQYALPPESVQGGQGSSSTCRHGPVAQPVSNCSGCSPTCHNVPQPCGAHHFGGDYGRGPGVMESRDDRHGWDGGGQRRGGKGWPSGGSTGGWRTPQSSPAGWQEKPQGEGRGRGNGDNWPGRRQNFDRPWGEQRRGAGDSGSWKSGSQDWRREKSAFGSNYTNNKRTQEGCPRPPWGAPDAKRPMDNAKVSWPKAQGAKESAGFLDRPANDGRGKTAAQEEDWETDYEKEQASSADVPAGKEKERAAADSPKPSVSASPLPELGLKPQAVAGKPPVATCVDQSKNGGFVAFLKNLYSDLPKKSSSGGSSDLVVDTDVESSKPDEEEERSPENEAGGELNSWE